MGRDGRHAARRRSVHTGLLACLGWEERQSLDARRACPQRHRRSARRPPSAGRRQCELGRPLRGNGAGLGQRDRRGPRRARACRNSRCNRPHRASPRVRKPDVPVRRQRHYHGPGRPRPERVRRRRAPAQRDGAHAGRAVEPRADLRQRHRPRAAVLCLRAVGHCGGGDRQPHGRQRDGPRGARPRRGRPAPLPLAQPRRPPPPRRASHTVDRNGRVEQLGDGRNVPDRPGHDPARIRGRGQPHAGLCSRRPASRRVRHPERGRPGRRRGASIVPAAPGIAHPVGADYRHVRCRRQVGQLRLGPVRHQRHARRRARPSPAGSL